jgi:long-chain acyl-CoA synthetase
MESCVPSCAPPPLIFEGTVWLAASLRRLALGWRHALRAALGEDPSPTAMVLANHPEAVALFFGLSALPAPLILLPAEPRGWRTNPPIPGGTRLVLAPAQQAFRPLAERLGLSVTTLADDVGAAAPDAPFMTAPAVVLFTSGSTDLPRPVCRPMPHLLRAATAVAQAADYPARGGIIGSLPLSRIFGLHHCLLAAALLGRTLALLPRFHHRAVLDLFASGDYHYWAGTPFMADFLGRSVGVAVRHPAPARCVISGRLSEPVSERWNERFGVPLRQVYGTTETGPITLDSGAPDEVRSGTAGTPLPGAAVVVGDQPERPAPAGALGAIWARTPWSMEGYGFPGHVKPRRTVGGWWPTPDVGYMDAAGYLTVTGRKDDCIRTAAGHLVNPGDVAAAVERYRGIVDAAVVPLGDALDPAVGVLVEAAATLDLNDLRRHLAGVLPSWSRPRVIERVDALPRLAGGKVDRLACIDLLARARARGDCSRR